MVPSARNGRGREPRGTRALDTPAAFRASMPERYRGAFDGSAIREHAAIVARRGKAPALVEIWKREPRGRAVMCIVADDRPGLLSLVSAALNSQNLDVVAAQAYTRTVAGAEAEAVDFVWVARSAEVALPVRSMDATRVAAVLRSLIQGEATVDAVARQGRKPSTPPPGATTRVMFDEAPKSGLAVLTVETFDRPGLLLAITLALFRARVQIVASDATTESGRVVDRFTVAELDGAPVRGHRRGAVQTAVLAAIDTLSERRARI
jgi:[protein-PII] uridylyltransferase